MSAPLLSGPGLITRTLRVAASDIAWVIWIVEAHDGLASVHGAGDGTITLIAPREREDALDALVGDLAAEIALERC
ncbi:MAG: DUF4911 domain-containing protein [Sandaracinaceae bacterium]|nr:DUF4911 domain-containing protein [Sandaracinaceae bacterium]